MLGQTFAAYQGLHGVSWGNSAFLDIFFSYLFFILSLGMGAKEWLVIDIPLFFCKSVSSPFLIEYFSVPETKVAAILRVLLVLHSKLLHGFKPKFSTNANCVFLIAASLMAPISALSSNPSGLNMIKAKASQKIDLSKNIYPYSFPFSIINRYIALDPHNLCERT